MRNSQRIARFLQVRENAREALSEAGRCPVCDKPKAKADETCRWEQCERELAGACLDTRADDEGRN